MKKFCLFISLSLMYSCMAQIFGPQQVITDFANGAHSIWMADIDGDDIEDIVSANKFGSTITWYKHLDGLGSFGSFNVVGILNQTISCYVADLDGDDDMDILGVSGPDDMVVWYENLGNGDFSVANILTSNFDGAYEVRAVDIDGDDDLDVVASADNIDTIVWFENLNGKGNFSPQKDIATTGNGGRAFRIGDIDGDLDLDIVASSGGAMQLTWFENLDGLGNYGAPISIEVNGLAVTSVQLSDIDGDNDLDVIGGVFAEDKIVWYENLDGAGNFGAANLISSITDAVRDVEAADLDMDDDMDVVSVSVGDFKLAWYNNQDGLGNFGIQQVISTNVVSTDILVNDLDKDGDLDLIIALPDDDEIVWYENLTILSVDTNIAEKVKLVPNPVDDSFEIKTNFPIHRVKIIGTEGKIIMHIEENFDQIPTKSLQSGIYLVEIQIENHRIVKKLIKQ